MSPVGICLLKLINGKTRISCEICSKLTIKASERGQWRRSCVFNVNLDSFQNLFWCFYSWLWTDKCALWYHQLHICFWKKYFTLLISTFHDVHNWNRYIPIKTSHLHYQNWLTGFYMRGTWASNWLRSSSAKQKCLKWMSYPGPLTSSVWESDLRWTSSW